MKTTDGLADGNFGIEIENLMQFERLVVRIKKLKGVESVMRESGIKHNDISEKVFDHIENFSDT